MKIQIIEWPAAGSGRRFPMGGWYVVERTEHDAYLPLQGPFRTRPDAEEAARAYCTSCGAAIDATQASLSSMRRDDARPTCADCCTAELTRAREQAEHEADDPHCTCNDCIASHAARLDEGERDEAYERAAARARGNDFADTGGKDWT